MFLAALSLSFISKALSAIIMKGSITQIERRFDISSSTVGLIDGSFEMGNFCFCFDYYLVTRFAEVKKVFTYALHHWSLTRGKLPPSPPPAQGQFGNIWRYFWLSSLRIRECHWHLVVEARDALKHPTMHKTASKTKNYLVQNVKSIEVKKPWFTQTHCLQTNILQG